MKKQGILNSHISKVLSELGHTDTIVIADCGLPIPQEVKRIDIALKPGMPGFLNTLETVLEDMKIEKATLAREIQVHNPSLHQDIQSLIDQETEYVPHEQFKQLTREAKAIIRTGEATPYANIILHAGVIF